MQKQGHTTRRSVESILNPVNNATCQFPCLCIRIPLLLSLKLAVALASGYCILHHCTHHTFAPKGTKEEEKY